MFWIWIAALLGGSAPELHRLESASVSSPQAVKDKHAVFPSVYKGILGRLHGPEREQDCAYCIPDPELALSPDVAVVGGINTLPLGAKIGLLSTFWILAWSFVLGRRR